MAIPTEQEFTALIQIFEMINEERLLPEGTQDIYRPNKSDVYDFLNRLYDSFDKQNSLWLNHPANVWFDKQPNYCFGMETVFGKRPEIKSRAVRIEADTQLLLNSYQPLSDTDYHNFVEEIVRDKTFYITRTKEKQECQYQLALSDPDPRNYYPKQTDDEIAEDAEWLYPVPDKEERNSEEYRTKIFKSEIQKLYSPHNTFKWSIFFVEAVKEYFYGDNNFDIYTNKTIESRVAENQKSLSGSVELVNYLERLAAKKDTWSSSTTYHQFVGPYIDEKRKLIREIEFVQMDIRRELEIDLDKLNYPPTISRVNNSTISRVKNTVKERRLIYKIWSYFMLHHKGRNVIAISQLISLEGIENSLDPRTISRLIHKWSKDSYLHSLLK